MAGLDPAVHVSQPHDSKACARVKPGHDDPQLFERWQGVAASPATADAYDGGVVWAPRGGAMRRRWTRCRMKTEQPISAKMPSMTRPNESAKRLKARPNMLPSR